MSKRTPITQDHRIITRHLDDSPKGNNIVNKPNRFWSWLFIKSQKQDVDDRTLKLIVGLIALSLAIVEGILTRGTVTSISASYHVGGWPQTIFVGCLFAIAAFLLAYNGKTRFEKCSSKFAAFAALGVAMFPCGCGGHPEIVPKAHDLSAAVLFLILASYCFIFLERAEQKYKERKNANQRGWEKYPPRVRSGIYAICLAGILGAIILLVWDNLSEFFGMSKFPLSSKCDKFVFWAEFAALFSFGLSWLAASRVILGLASAEEHFNPFTGKGPPND